MVEDDADEVVLETEITNKPALKLYDPIRQCIETEDVNPMTGLTADTPANPDDESNRTGSHTRETKYATEKTEGFGTNTSGKILTLVSPRTHAQSRNSLLRRPRGLTDTRTRPRTSRRTRRAASPPSGLRTARGRDTRLPWRSPRSTANRPLSSAGGEELTRCWWPST